MYFKPPVEDLNQMVSKNIGIVKSCNRTRSCTKTLHIFHLKIKDLNVAADKFSNEQYECFLKYVNKGSEFNSRLRNARLLQDGDSALVKNLNKSFMPLHKLFPLDETNTDYIKVCRNMSSKWKANKSAGFVSTSNKNISRFGDYNFTILIPRDAKIGIINIDYMFNGIKNVYEIILPNNLPVIQLENNHNDVYLIFKANGDFQHTEELTV